MNQRLQQLLRSLRRAVRLHLALAGLARAGAVAMAAALGSWLLDWSFRLEFGPRGMISTGALIIIGVALWRYALRPLSRALADTDLALALERAFPQFGDRLLTVVETAVGAHGSELSPALLERVATEAMEIAARVEPVRALDRRRLLQHIGIGLAALLAAAAATALFPREASIWWQRNVLLRDVDWPRATQLEVLGFPNGVTRMVRGAPLDIVVAASGRKIPETVRLELDYENAGRFHELLTPAGHGRFAKHLDAVVENFRFRATGGDGETQEMRVEVVDPPMLRDVRLRLVYPAYTRQPPHESGPSEGAVEAVVGTRIELRAVSTKPLKSSRLQAPSSKPAATVSVENGTHVSARLIVQASGPVQISLEDTEGLRAERALAFALYAQPDRPPTVRLTLSGIGDKITPVATLPLAAEARDDFGVASLSLAWSTNNNHWSSQPASNTTLGAAEVRHETRWPIELLHLAEGMVLNLRVEAADAATPAGKGASQPLALRVVSAAELLADLTRRQKEYRAEFERLTHKERDALDQMTLAKEPGASVGQSQVAAWLADEREIGNGCLNMAELFRRILEEQQNNRVSTPAEQQRLRAHIIEPLGEVGRQLLGPVVEPLSAITPSMTAPLQPAFAAAQITYDRMRAILKEMIRGETVADAIATLRDILKDQDQINSATRKTLEEEIRRLLKGP